MLLALVMTSVATVVMRSRAGMGIAVVVITLPCMMWPRMKPEWRRQWVMALDALTNSTVAELAARRSRAAFCMHVTVVAHQGLDVSVRLQLRFATCASKWRDVPVLRPSYTAPHP